MNIRKYGILLWVAVLTLGPPFETSAQQNPPGKTKPRKMTGIEKEIADLLGQCRDSGSFASTGMTLLNTMANKKLKGIDVALAKRKLYRLRYKVVALREEAPELTKSDLLIYKNTLTDPSMKLLFDLMKDADPEKQTFDLVRYDRISRGYTFVVCGGGDIFAFTLRPSEAGIFGASIYIVTPKATLAIRDLTVLIGNQNPTDWQSKLTVKEVTYDLRGNALRITHKMDLGGEFDVVATMRPNGQTIRIDVESPKGVSDMFIGPTDLAPKEIHLGGQVIKEPKSMTLKAGDAKLTERFVGVDFGNGLSLVQASEKADPLSLIVEPDKKTCALHTGAVGMLWLAPTSRGVLHAVAQWRGVPAREK
ncbi:MAG: hypothetical protein GXP25_17635 [Planctomycetes bacterium]|nr:hypothetical protein [Planctomycetota bacterium]